MTTCKKFLTIGVLLFNCFTTLSAANPVQPNRTTLSLGVFSVTSNQVMHHPDGDYFEKIPMASVKINYQVVKSIEFGGYLAYTNMSHGIPLEYKSEGVYVLIDSEGVERFSGSMKYMQTTSHTFFYGIMARYDLLPLLTGKENLRFNLHISPRFGLVSARWNELVGTEWEMNWNGPFVEYGAGFGVGYFLTKRVGIGISYSMGQFYNNDNSRWYAGISFRF